MAAYRVALRGNVRQVRGLRAGGVIIEAEIPQDSYLAGRLVAEVPWPRDAVLVAIERHDGLVVPRGDLRLEAGDRISIFAAPAANNEVEALLSLASEPHDLDLDDDTRVVRGAAT
jgi:Trk K+ transport system NAD-binding subunit